MKKFNHLLALCAAIVIAATFFAACPDGNGDEPEGGVTYTLIVHDVSLTPDDTASINYTLAASDSSGTDDIEVTFVCTDAACTLTINDAEITATAGESPGTHSFTATAKKDGKTIAAKAFTVTVIALGDIEAALLVIEDMAIYRMGGTEASRTIEFTLLDTEMQPITSRNFLENVTVEYTSTLTITGGVIQESKTYTEGKHDVGATAAIGTDELECDFEVTVSKLMFDVKFYNGTAELASLAASVEYGDTVTNPGDPNIADYIFDKWVTADGGSTAFDFAAPITGHTSIYASESDVPPTEYTLAVTVTIGQDAPLEADEIVIIQGGWRGGTNLGQTDNATYILTEQANGTWTGTVPNISIANYSTFNYNLYAEKNTVTVGSNGRPSSSMTYAVRAMAGGSFPFTHAGGATGVLNHTVTEWFGRPEVVAGNLLGNSGFEDGTGWNYNNNQQAPWTIVLNNATNPASRWLRGDPDMHGGSRVWQDHDTGGTAYWLNSTTAANRFARITQSVSATNNPENVALSAGMNVTLSVWIRRVSGNLGQKDMALLVGAQSYNVMGDLTTATTWQEISHTFTLASGDFSGGNLTNVGLEYWATGIDDTKTFVDDFILAVTP